MACIINLSDRAKVVKEKVIYYYIDKQDTRNFKIILEGPFEVQNIYETDDDCRKNFEEFDKIMQKH